MAALRKQYRFFPRSCNQVHTVPTHIRHHPPRTTTLSGVYAVEVVGGGDLSTVESELGATFSNIIPLCGRPATRRLPCSHRAIQDMEARLKCALRDYEKTVIMVCSPEYCQCVSLLMPGKEERQCCCDGSQSLLMDWAQPEERAVVYVAPVNPTDVWLEKYEKQGVGQLKNITVRENVVEGGSLVHVVIETVKRYMCTN